MDELDEFRQAHDIIHCSLREILIPSELWATIVETFESDDEHFKFTFTDAFKADSKNRYMPPYVYTDPVWSLYLDDFNDPNKIISGEINAKVTKGIVNRLTPIYGNSVTDEFISAIDDNYDCGAIVHATSGKIIPFEYSAVSGFIFEHHSPMLKDYASILYNSNVGEIEKAYATGVYHAIGSIASTLSYRFIPTDVCSLYGFDNEYKKFHEVFGAEDCATYNQINSLVDYMQAMYNRHAKVLILP